MPPLGYFDSTSIGLQFIIVYHGLGMRCGLGNRKNEKCFHWLLAFLLVLGTSLGSNLNYELWRTRFRLEDFKIWLGP